MVGSFRPATPIIFIKNHIANRAPTAAPIEAGYVCFVEWLRIEERERARSAAKAAAKDKARGRLRSQPPCANDREHLQWPPTRRTACAWTRGTEERGMRRRRETQRAFHCYRDTTHRLVRNVPIVLEVRDRVCVNGPPVLEQKHWEISASGMAV